MIADEHRPPSVDTQPTETSPLLAGQDETVGSQPSSRLSQIMQFQRAHLALPVVFFGFMSGTITITASIQIVNIIACQFWYTRHDPSKIPPDGNIPAALCQAPAVEKLFAQFVQIAVIVDLCGAVVTSSPIGTLSAKFGRKPLFIITTILAMTAPLLVLMALYNGSLLLLCMATVIGAFGGPRQLLLLSTMFVVDVASDPALILSVLEGSINMGYAISLALGGLLTRWSGSVTYVFRVQIAILVVLLLYIIVAIPESFGWEKRAARAAEIAAEQSRGRGRTSQRRSRSRSTSVASLERVRDTAGAFARPFGLIWPQRDPVTGKRDNRLLFLAIGILFAFTGTSYAGPAFLVYATGRFHATPEQNGYILSSVATGKTLYLFLIIPPILKWGRALYKKPQSTEGQDPDADSSGTGIDVHILAFSWLVDSIAMLGIGLSPNLAAADASLMVTAIGAAAGPCISTIVSANVGPLARGEALAAISLVRFIAEFLSPVILGSILSNTINTPLPQTAFFTASLLLFLAAGIVVFIRDSSQSHDEDGLWNGGHSTLE